MKSFAGVQLAAVAAGAALALTGCGGESEPASTSPDAAVVSGNGESIHSAKIISELPFLESGTTTGHVHDVDVHCCDYPYSCFHISSAPDVVYAYAPPSDGRINVSLCGSLYDTVLDVLLEDGTSVACNDNSIWACGVAQSHLEAFRVNAGVTLYFVISGIGPASGEYLLNVTEWTPSQTCTPSVQVHLPEDAPHRQSGTTCGSGGSLYHNRTCLGGYGTGEQVFYQIEVSQDGCFDLVLDPKTSRTSSMALGDVCPPAEGGSACLGASASISPVPHGISVDMKRGTYYLLVSSPIDEEEGETCLPEYELSISPCALPPGNDSCENATELSASFPETITGTTRGATLDCPGVLGVPAIWYSIALPHQANQVTIDFSRSCDRMESLQAFSAVFASDCSCSKLSSFALGSGTCDDESFYPVLKAALPGPTSILYPAWLGDLTDFTFTVDVEPLNPPKTGDFSVTAPGTWSADTCGAGNDFDTGPGDDQLWQITIPYDGRWVFSTCGTSSPWNSFLSLGRSAGLQELGSDDDGCGMELGNSKLQVDLSAGTYFLTADGLDRLESSSCGQYQLEVLEVQPPKNDECAEVIPWPLKKGATVELFGTTEHASSDCGKLFGLAAAEVWEAFVTSETLNIEILDYGALSETLGRPILVRGCPCSDYIVPDYPNTVLYPEIGSVFFYQTFVYENLPPGTYYLPILEPKGSYHVQLSSVTPPPNDACTDVSPVALAAGSPLEFSGTTRGATNDGASDACLGSTGGFAEVWHSFSTSEPLDITIDFCGTSPVFGAPFDGLWKICPCRFTESTYLYDAFLELTLIDATICDDKNPAVVIQNVPPGTYYFPVLMEPEFADGPYTIHVSGAAIPNPPANDDCAAATPVPVGPGAHLTLAGTTSFATEDCNLVARAEVWEAFVTEEELNLEIEFCSEESGVSMLGDLTQCPCKETIPLTGFELDACGGKGIRTRYAHLPAGAYFLGIGQGVDPRFDRTYSGGPYTVEIGASVPSPRPENDNCANAMPVGDVEGLAFDLADASFDGAGACLATSNLWYLYTAPASGLVHLGIEGSSGDPKLALYDGAACPVTTEAAAPFNYPGGEEVEHAAAIAVPWPAAFMGVTWGQTHDYALSCAGGSTSPDVVYSYSPVSDEVVDLSLCDSFYDTVLAVFEDDETNEVACSDNDCGLQSRLDAVSLRGGHRYYFVIGGGTRVTKGGEYLFSVRPSAYFLTACGEAQATFQVAQGQQFLIEVSGSASTGGAGALIVRAAP
jgi:hypothetical protein